MTEINLVVDGTPVLIEYAGPLGPGKAGFTDNLVASFEDAEAIVRKLATGFTKSLHSLQEGLAPDEAEIEFGLKVNATANWVVSKIDADASFSITLKWKLKP